VLKKNILPCQNTFIRDIMDGVLSLHEILDDTKHEKQQGVDLKIDFEKAYNKINWEFLFEWLQKVVSMPFGVVG
jgi:hypothetical protein